MVDLVLVDSGGANIASVFAALSRLGIDAELTADADRIRRAERVILPGVGAAAPAMAKLRAHGLVDVLRSLSQPLLGICLGMQLLYDASVEGGERVECLGLIPGDITALEPSDGVRIPHMGWNVLEFGTGLLSDRPSVSLTERGAGDGSLGERSESTDTLKEREAAERSLSERSESKDAPDFRRAVTATGPEPRAYFVHSYAAPVTADTVATTTHGRTFTSIVSRGSVHGAQFHPERSARVGAALLREFAFCEGNPA